MDAPANDAVAFRTSRGMTAVYVGLSLFVLAIAWLIPSLEVEDGMGPCAVAWFGFVGVLLVWSAVVFATRTKFVSADGLVVRGLLRTRRWPWARLERWGVTVNDPDAEGRGQRTVWLKFAGKFLSVHLHDFELARPGFDRFLGLVRQYAGDKEGPRPQTSSRGFDGKSPDAPAE